MSSAVFPYYLIMKPNSYLAFGSQSAASLMLLPMINLPIMSCSKKVQKELHKNLRCLTVIIDLEKLTQGEEN